MAAAAAQQPVSAQVVGDAFVQQYYNVLHQSPEHVYRFYQEISKLGRPEGDGTMSVTTTMQAISEKIMSFHCTDHRVEITSVDAQQSFNDGVHVLVTGFLQGKDNNSLFFTQTFFLAPQEKGYFVLNDMVRFMGEKYEEGYHNPTALANDVEAPLTPEQGHSPVQETLDPKQMVETVEAIEDETIDHCDAEQASDDEKGVPVPEVDEVPDDSKLAVIPSPNAEDVPKKTYASIVMIMKENPKPFSSPAPAPRKPAAKSLEQVNLAQTPATEKPVADSDSTENANTLEGEADGCSIYVKGLPLNATPTQLEEEFKKFGAIKNGGIQVRSNKQGFCFGFVEFEVASAAQQAIEASPVIIGGRQAHVEEKKSANSRGGGRGRFLNGRGLGFRNEGIKGRGNFGSGRGGGAGYNRGDLNGRPEFGSRGGNRGDRGGGHGYQTPGGRPNREGVNVMAKTTAPRVTATA